jgi:hypothetical protein
MTVNESELRAESDATLAALDTIRELEERKRHLPPQSEEFLSAARQVTELSHVLTRTVTRQEEIAEAVVRGAREAAPARDRPITAIPPTDSLPAILAAWRNAERRLAEAAPGSDEERDLRQAIDDLRRSYAKAHEKNTEGETGLKG